MPQDEMHEITRHAAELVGIQDHLDYAPHELSGGQKQRVSLAGVMVDQVKILLFDEPLANLDPATGKQTIELIDEIQEKTDKEVRITVPGHTQRGGSPCAYDRVLATRLGAEAARAILEGDFGCMVGTKNQEIIRVPLSEVAGKLKYVDPKASIIKEAKTIGISFGDE